MVLKDDLSPYDRSCRIEVFGNLEGMKVPETKLAIRRLNLRYVRYMYAGSDQQERYNHQDSFFPC